MSPCPDIVILCGGVVAAIAAATASPQPTFEETLGLQARGLWPFFMHRTSREFLPPLLCPQRQQRKTRIQQLGMLSMPATIPSEWGPASSLHSCPGGLGGAPALISYWSAHHSRRFGAGASYAPLPSTPGGDDATPPGRSTHKGPLVMRWRRTRRSLLSDPS